MKTPELPIEGKYYKIIVSSGDVYVVQALLVKEYSQPFEIFNIRFDYAVKFKFFIKPLDMHGSRNEKDNTEWLENSQFTIIERNLKRSDILIEVL